MPISRPHHTVACLITLGLVSLLAACGDSSQGDQSGATPTPTATPTVTATAAPSPAADPSSPATAYEGTWRAGPTPYSAVDDALEAAGLGKWATVVRQGNPASSQLSYDLKVQGGFVLLTSTVDGRSLGVQDRQGFTADGSTFTLSPIGGSCESTFGWRVQGDQLTLALTEDTCPDYQGTPDEAFMRALYTAVPFTRVV